MVDHPLGHLAPVLSARTERWGWEFVDPGVARPSPQLSSEPRWVEPVGPDIGSIRNAQHQARQHLGRKIAVVIVALFMMLSLPSSVGWLFFLGAMGLGYYWFAPLLLANSRIQKLKVEAGQRRAAAWDHFQREHDHWTQEVRTHDAAEAARLAWRDVYFPLEMDPPPSRVDVFGGTTRGWVNLLTTMGGSVLGSGTPLLIIDFTQHRLSAALQELADLRSLRFRRYELPAELFSLSLFDGLDAEQLAELLAECVHIGGSASDRQELVSVGSDLLRLVIAALDGRVTFRRIVAGLRVLDRTYFDESDDVLTMDERSCLSRRVDNLAQTERTRDELSRLISALGRLGRAESTTSTDSSGARRPPEADVPLMIFEASHDSEAVKELMDAVVFHAVSAQVRSGASWVSGRVVVVAGADRMGLRSLEAMHRQAQRQGIRLVYLFHHLRDELQQLIGGADSSVLIMRMANQQQAQLAAEFIGRGHKYVLGQITRSLGETDTVGGGTSQTTTDTYAETFTRTKGSAPSRSYSEASSIARSFMASDNWSKGTTTTHGTTDTRVYEFAMEPTQIVDLPDTAFVLIDRGVQGRRVAVGDSDPKYYFLDRVSEYPWSALEGMTDDSSSAGWPMDSATPQMSSIKIPDPSRSLVVVADQVRDLGYVVRYEEDDGNPTLNGWRITRGDGRPLDEVDQQRIQQAYAATTGRR